MCGACVRRLQGMLQIIFCRLHYIFFFLVSANAAKITDKCSNYDRPGALVYPQPSACCVSNEKWAAPAASTSTSSSHRFASRRRRCPSVFKNSLIVSEICLASSETTFDLCVSSRRSRSAPTTPYIYWYIFKNPTRFSTSIVITYFILLFSALFNNRNLFTCALNCDCIIYGSRESGIISRCEG